MSAVGGGQLSTPESFPETSELKLTLNVKKRGTRMSLDGIVFYPVIAGIVVTDDDICLDGRHRVAFHKENNISTLPAYIVPRSQVDKFIESL